MEKGTKVLMTVGVFVVLVIILGFMTIRNIEQGEVCVVTAFGKVNRMASPGFNLKMPFFVERFNCFSTRLLVYETGDEPGQSQADYTDIVVEANTADGQVIQVRYSVSFHVEPNAAMTVYTKVGRNDDDVVERVVKFHSRSKVRLTLQEYKADVLYSGNIVTVQTEIEDQLDVLFAANNVSLDAFVLRKISFDPDYVAAIEQQQIAKENIETAQYQSQAAVYEAQKNIEIAKGQAQANIELAKGEAEAVKIQAAADAEALSLKGVALRNFPEMLKLEMIQALKYAKFMFFPSDSITPFLPLPTD